MGLKMTKFRPFLGADAGLLSSASELFSLFSSYLKHEYSGRNWHRCRCRCLADASPTPRRRRCAKIGLFGVVGGRDASDDDRRPKIVPQVASTNFFLTEIKLSLSLGRSLPNCHSVFSLTLRLEFKSVLTSTHFLLGSRKLLSDSDGLLLTTF